MDTLVQDYSVHLNSGFISDQNLANRCRLVSHDFKKFPVFSSNGSDDSSSSAVQSSLEVNDEDYYDAPLKYISQMLMEEEDLERKPCMFYDCMALQATEKSFYEALQEPQAGHPISVYYGTAENQNGGFLQTYNTSLNSTSSSDGDGFAESNSIPNQEGLESSSLQFSHEDADFSAILAKIGMERNKNHQLNGSAGKKHQREGTNSAEDGNSSKLLATSADDSFDSLEMYDNVFLCSNSDKGSNDESAVCSTPKASSPSGIVKIQRQNKQSKRQRLQGGSKRKSTVPTEAVDLRNLLLQCAQAVASFDTRTAEEFLRRIRQHSSPSGDSGERVAHFFANALEARLSGTGTALYSSSGLKKISAAELLKAYQVYVSACPFKRMSNMYANKCIKRVAGGASTVHIIDFGILYGFQWPCLIQAMSQLPGGPRKLRITGIDFPQPGFRPAERVEETGRRLAKYCERFNVPFEYNAIAQKWETIQLEDLHIDPNNEVIAVNSLYRMENVPDETVVTSSPRDAVLQLIKKINPDIFVHGVTNGTYNSPFFATRFREALFYFSSLFDMFEATLEREDPQRLLFEREVIGRDAMNVIACEGTERVERSETYKQWQARNLRAGFRQLPLDQEILKEVRDQVKKHHHKDFLVDEDGNWMLQGWRGKITCSLSCWKSTNRRW